MARIRFSDVGDTPFQRLLGYLPGARSHWSALEDSYYASTTFEPELLEQVRRTLAWGNGCEYCKAIGGPPDGSARSERISLAVAYAQLILADHRAIDDAQFALVRSEFGDAALSELTAFICFTTASHMLGAIMHLSPDDRASGGST